MILQILAIATQCHWRVGNQLSSSALPFALLRDIPNSTKELYTCCMAIRQASKRILATCPLTTCEHQYRWFNLITRWWVQCMHELLAESAYVLQVQIAYWHDSELRVDYLLRHGSACSYGMHGWAMMALSTCHATVLALCFGSPKLLMQTVPLPLSRLQLLNRCFACSQQIRCQSSWTAYATTP